jgi:hypothetical protein
MTVSCRVCGIDDWLNCGCYYLTGGIDTKGDMNAKVFMCPECGWVTECYPDCPVKAEI